MKNPLKTLYFDPSLVSLLRNQPALILKLAEQNRKFLQVVAHPDKMGTASTDYSAELNEAVDTLKDREQLGYYIEEYLQEIANTDQLKRERAVLGTVNQNLSDHIRHLEAEREISKKEIEKLQETVNAFEKKKQEQMTSWLMYRRPFTKILVPDTHLFLPEIQNVLIEVADENYLSIYFMFDWQTIRILEGKRQEVEKHLDKMHANFKEKGALPGRKLPSQYLAGCVEDETIFGRRASIPLSMVSKEMMRVSPFLEIGKTLVSCSFEQGKRDKEAMAAFMCRGKITDLRDFSFDDNSQMS